MQTILSVLFSLAAVLALVVLTIYVTKLLMKKFNFQGGAGSGIDIIACRGISADKALMAVKVGEKRLLLGVTAGDIKVLAELSEDDENSIRTAGNTAAQGSFGEILAENFRRTFGAGQDKSGNNDKDGKL